MAPPPASTDLNLEGLRRDSACINGDALQIPDQHSLIADTKR